MDYREIIEAMRSTDPKEIFYHSIDAADAIETLLAEREAAVEDLRGMCWCCAHGKKYETGLPWSKATTCEHMRELGAAARSGGKCKCQFWQWRGPKKGENHDQTKL